MNLLRFSSPDPPEAYDHLPSQAGVELIFLVHFHPLHRKLKEHASTSYQIRNVPWIVNGGKTPERA